MRHLARLLILALLISMIIIPASAESIRVYVAVNTLKCYSSNSTSSSHIGTLGYGEAATCIAHDETWAIIEIDGSRGYCKIDGLTTKDPNSGSITAYVVSGGAKAHTRPGSSYKSIELESGTKLTVVAMTPDKNWCRVKKSSSYAYIKTENLSTEPVEKEKSTANKPVTAYIADENVTIYKSASGSSDRVATGAYGEKLTCLAIDGGWAKVEYGSTTGWCYTNKLTTSNPNTYSTTVYAKDYTVSVYTHPSTSANVMTTMTKGDGIKAVCLTPDGSWLRVTASGKYGYVRKGAMSTSKPTSQIDKLIELALDQLGKPYIYATRGPKSFDCSGLTLYCYREIAGISLGRSAQSQGYYTNFPKIENYSDLKRGDIVCFNTEEDDADLTDHVGIYLGNGEFVHASSVAGKVIISTMSSGYYRRVFSWGLRLIY